MVRRKTTDPSSAEQRLITPRLLRAWPLPPPDEGGDKEARGRVLVVGGAPEMPGACVLAATAAARAGAGKLQIATCSSVAAHVAVTVPEARVFALLETRAGALAASGVAQLGEHLAKAQAVLVGPGMIDDATIARFVKGLLAHVRDAALV